MSEHDSAGGGPDEPVLPPLPKVDLPEINRAPVADRSSAAYAASTPGLGAPDAQGSDRAHADSVAASSDPGAATRSDADAAAADGPLPSPFPAPQPASTDEPTDASGATVESRENERANRPVWPWIAAPAAIVVIGGVWWLVASGALG